MRNLNLNYNIVNSGSDGNCVRIENIMFDIGVKFDKLKEDLQKVNVICITHAHSDHITKGTVKKIHNLRPLIHWVIPVDVYQKFPIFERIQNVHIVDVGLIVQIGSVIIETFECFHDVPCVGYSVEFNNTDVIYATDTYSMDGAPIGKTYDYIFIESNHDEDIIMRAIHDKKNGPHAKAALRHLSKQKSIAFYLQRRKETGCVYKQLHQSRLFY
jgi:mRNA degradation ribonuclease J1/J2